MKKNTRVKIVLFSALLISSISTAMSESTVYKSNEQLTVSFDVVGTVIAKIIGPDDVSVVNERFSGNSFNWYLNSEPDGTYRYEVRIIEQSPTNDEGNSNKLSFTGTNKINYAGGMIEVKNGSIIIAKEK